MDVNITNPFMFKTFVRVCELYFHMLYVCLRKYPPEKKAFKMVF